MKLTFAGMRQVQIGSILQEIPRRPKNGSAKAAVAFKAGGNSTPAIGGAAPTKAEAGSTRETSMSLRGGRTDAFSATPRRSKFSTWASTSAFGLCAPADPKRRHASAIVDGAGGEKDVFGPP